MNDDKKKALRLKFIKRNLRDVSALLEEIDWKTRFDFRMDKLLYFVFGAAVVGLGWFTISHLYPAPNAAPQAIAPPVIERPILAEPTSTPSSTLILATSTPSSTAPTSTGK